MNIHRLTGGPIFASQVKLAPGYELVPDGTDLAPGRVGGGLFAENEATVCLLFGDSGNWFKEQVASWKEYGKPPRKSWARRRDGRHREAV